LTRTLFSHVIPRHPPIERTVELLLRAVRPQENDMVPARLRSSG
jgi:hypothetical protein